MKLLFDQNLSPRLAKGLIDLFPGSTHVTDAGLDAADDEDVWRYAKDNDFTIVCGDAGIEVRG